MQIDNPLTSIVTDTATASAAASAAATANTAVVLPTLKYSADQKITLICAMDNTRQPAQIPIEVLVSDAVISNTIVHYLSDNSGATTMPIEMTPDEVTFIFGKWPRARVGLSPAVVDLEFKANRGKTDDIPNFVLDEFRSLPLWDVILMSETANRYEIKDLLSICCKLIAEGIKKNPYEIALANMAPNNKKVTVSDHITVDLEKLSIK